MTDAEMIECLTAKGYIVAKTFQMEAREQMACEHDLYAYEDSGGHHTRCRKCSYAHTVGVRKPPPTYTFWPFR